MIGKDEAIQILKRFEDHYDEQDRRNCKKYHNPDNYFSEISLAKMIACYGLRTRFCRSDETDIFEMVRLYKDHYNRLLERDQALDDTELWHRHYLVREAIDCIEKRLRTIEKNKTGKKAS